MKVGLALPSFSSDPGVPIAVAQAADDAGVDGVFVYDHLFRFARDGHRRPALECLALLGAVAASTRRVQVGTLVARAWLRPAVSLATGLGTVERLAPGRLVAAIGAGDSESRQENETFGLGFGSVDERVACLRDTVRAARDRGFPVWVGGTARAVRAVASAEADGWNAWGLSVESFESRARSVRSSAARTPFDCSWGGVVVLAGDDKRARAKAERLGADRGTLVGGPSSLAHALARYRDAGAAWAVVAPLDPSDPANAVVLGEEVVPALAAC